MKQPILYLRCNVSDGDLEEKCIQCGKTKCGAGFCRAQIVDQGASVDAQGQVLYHCWHTGALWRIVYAATQVVGGEEVEALAAERWSLFDITLSSFSLFLPILQLLCVFLAVLSVKNTGRSGCQKHIKLSCGLREVVSKAVAHFCVL